MRRFQIADHIPKFNFSQRSFFDIANLQYHPCFFEKFPDLVRLFVFAVSQKFCLSKCHLILLINLYYSTWKLFLRN